MKKRFYFLLLLDLITAILATYVVSELIYKKVAIYICVILVIYIVKKAIVNYATLNNSSPKIDTSKFLFLVLCVIGISYTAHIRKKADSISISIDDTNVIVQELERKIEDLEYNIDHKISHYNDLSNALDEGGSANLKAQWALDEAESANLKAQWALDEAEQARIEAQELD